MKKVSKLLSVLLVVVMMLSLCVVGTFAADNDPMTALTTDVYNALKENKYDKEGGGSLKGSELFVKTDDGTGYDLNEDTYGQLTSEAQTALIQNIYDASYQSAETNQDVSNDTVSNWFTQLQSKEGAGTKLMLIIADTKPDFAAATHIYEPFKGPIGVILGVLSLLLMGFLAIVMVLDISYIALPPMRMIIGDAKDSKNGGGFKSYLVSNDAVYAVKTVEEGNDGDGSKKQALGIYLKRRIPMLILLGVCLMFLVQGQIYALVGKILDLVSGFLGF